MSSEKSREKRDRRKSKVSWGRLIRPGLVDPKPRPTGVGDGQGVNIRPPACMRFNCKMTREDWGCRRLDVSVSVQAIAWREAALRQSQSDLRPPAKKILVKEHTGCSYRKPTQVDLQKMVRRSRELSLRNSAK